MAVDFCREDGQSRGHVLKELDRAADVEFEFVGEGQYANMRFGQQGRNLRVRNRRQNFDPSFGCASEIGQLLSLFAITDDPETQPGSSHVRSDDSPAKGQ